ncbi:MAG: hypothetical protein ABI854_07225, partial [Betaproteobacteria bacterium]
MIGISRLSTEFVMRCLPSLRCIALASSLCVLVSAVRAEFDRAKVLVEPETVARQFPDPGATFAT